MTLRLLPFALVCAVSLLLTHEGESGENRAAMARRRAAAALPGDVGKPIFLRIIKDERELELWVQQAEGWRLLRRYGIAAMSGTVGPKTREGDRQAPEGFYRVTREALNPRSRYFLAFNIGYPNRYDRELKRTGSNIMVHGSCVSVGCFAITDESIAELYTMVAEALHGGQAYVPVQVYPFRMTAERMTQEAQSPHSEFWKHLLPGWQHTENTSTPYPDSDN